MRAKDIQLLYSSGDLQKCEIVPAPLVPGNWHVQFTRNSGAVITFSGKEGHDRIFGKLVTAAEWARYFGFERFGVYMPDMPEGKQRRVPLADDFKLN